MLHLGKALKDSEQLIVFSESAVPVQDNDGRPLTVCRAAAHAYGILHATANILLVLPERSRTGDALVILQKRSKEKPIFPGAWTVSCGGHMGTVLDPKDAAVREAEEEFGLTIPKDALVPIPKDDQPLENFLKVWRIQARTYSQLDDAAQTVLVAGEGSHDAAVDRDVREYLRATPPSSLGDNAPLGIQLDIYNREFCYYYLYRLPPDAEEAIKFSDGEAEGKQRIPISDFVRDARFMTDSSFTLIREVPDLRDKVENLVQ